MSDRWDNPCPEGHTMVIDKVRLDALVLTHNGVDVRGEIEGYRCVKDGEHYGDQGVRVDELAIEDTR